jgi:hypothetical protein
MPDMKYYTLVEKFGSNYEAVVSYGYTNLCVHLFRISFERNYLHVLQKSFIYEMKLDL